MKSDTWTGWCPLCWEGPFVLSEGRRVPQHNNNHGFDCSGRDMRAVNWQRAREGMRQRLYG